MTVHNILKDVVNEMFEAYRKEEPGADSIIRLAESGLVSLSTPYSVEDLEDVPDLELPFEQLSEEAAAKLPIVAKRIRKIWESPNAFPLFDEALGSLAELLLAQGPRAHSKGSGQQRELALADVFFGQLPGFPKATIDELLDIRTDLQDSLQRFRIALAGISEELAETRSMDEFHGEARSLWVTEVLPAVQEIEDSVRSNKYLYQLTEHFLTKRDGLVAAGGVVVGAMGPHDVPTLVLSAAASALPAARALWEAWKANLDIRHNKFYFVYSLDRRLRQIGPNQ